MDQTLTVEVTLTNKGTTRGPLPVVGWGDNGHAVAVEGQVGQIRVVRNGFGEFTLRIADDGTLTLTSYTGGYTMYEPQSLRLTPSRPWEPHAE